MRKYINSHLPKGLIKKWRRIKRRIKYIKKSSEFKGVGVYCPCCNRHFSKFQKFPLSDIFHNEKLFDSKLLEVICPYCDSYPRHRIICDYFEKHRPIFADSLIFSPAYSMQLWFKRNKVKYITADLFDRTADVQADIQAIPFKADKFDFISCDHVLEHVPDYILALKELLRVIKPGGCVEITVPLFSDRTETYEDDSITKPAERVAAFGQIDHLRIFGSDFVDKLREVGFAVSVYDGDVCDAKIVPLIAPARYDYNKVFICRK